MAERKLFPVYCRICGGLLCFAPQMTSTYCNKCSCWTVTELLKEEQLKLFKEVKNG